MVDLDLDKTIREWGDRLYRPIKGRKGKTVRGGRSGNKATSSAPSRSVSATCSLIARTTKKTPEVMVKITGTKNDLNKCRNIKEIKAHIDYISRNGKVEMEDERGNIYLGTDDTRDICNIWATGKIGIRQTGGRRREAHKIMLSMPPGTDRASVKDAARSFAAKEFKNHQYILATHDDTNHPHVHLTVKAVSNNGVRLNPRKNDLQHWREGFAEQLREHGIEANATPRRVRGLVKKAERQAVRHINEEFEKGKKKSPAKVEVSQRKAAAQEVTKEGKHINPARENIEKSRRETLAAYGQIARALSKGGAEDRALALQIVNLVKNMPQPETKHQALVKAYVKSQNKALEKTSELGNINRDNDGGKER